MNIIYIKKAILVFLALSYPILSSGHQYPIPDSETIKKHVCQYHLQAKESTGKSIFPELLESYFQNTSAPIQTNFPPSVSIEECLENQLADADLKIITQDNPEDIIKAGDTCSKKACIFAVASGTYQIPSTLKISENTILIARDLSNRFRLVPSKNFLGTEMLPNPLPHGFTTKCKFSAVDMKDRSAMIGGRLELDDFIESYNDFYFNDCNLDSIERSERKGSLVSIVNARSATLALSEIESNSNNENWFDSLVFIYNWFEEGSNLEDYIQKAKEENSITISKNFFSGVNKRIFIYYKDHIDMFDDYSTSTSNEVENKKKTLSINDNHFMHLSPKYDAHDRITTIKLDGGSVSLNSNSFRQKVEYTNNGIDTSNYLTRDGVFAFLILGSRLWAKENTFILSYNQQQLSPLPLVIIPRGWSNYIPLKTATDSTTPVDVTHPSSNPYDSQTQSQRILSDDRSQSTVDTTSYDSIEQPTTTERTSLPKTALYALVESNTFYMDTNFFLETERVFNQAVQSPLPNQEPMFGNRILSSPPPKELNVEVFFDNCLRHDWCNRPVENEGRSGVPALTTTRLTVLAIALITIFAQ